MIREKTILCKLNQIKASDKQLIDSMQPSNQTCPFCGTLNSCNPHATYKRFLIAIVDGSRTDEAITIRRAKCSSCARAHAMLPDVLIPFGSYSLRFVLHVLGAYLTKATTVAHLCETFHIAVSTLYKWIRLFKEHANLILCAVEQIAWVTVPALHFVEEVVALPSAFFLRYRFSFLQNAKRQPDSLVAN